MSNLLDVQDLRVEFKTQDGMVTAVNDLSFSSSKAKTLGIVGESGSGRVPNRFCHHGLACSRTGVTGDQRQC